MRCGYAEDSWEFWVCFDFGFRVSEICLFLCSSLMRFFVVQFFHFSGHCVASEEILMFMVAPFIDSIDLAIVAEADLRRGDFCPKKVVVTNW